MKLKPSKNDITGDIVKEVLENHKILATALVAGEELQVDEIRYLINNYNVLTKPQFKHKSTGPKPVRTIIELDGHYYELLWTRGDHCPVAGYHGEEILPQVARPVVKHEQKVTTTVTTFN